MNKKKVILTLTALSALGIAIYTIFHDHQGERNCFFCWYGHPIAFGCGGVVAAVYW